jgi:preprotein translocase subunit SecF
MRLPNIYEGNYSRLIVFPLALIIISLFLIPSIPQGIDFKGGTLLTMQLSGAVGEDQLRAVLDKAGITNYLPTLYQNPGGWVAEIEMLTDKRMDEIDKNLEGIDKSVESIDSLEAEAVRLRLQESASKSNLSARIADNEKKISDEMSNIKQLGSKIVELSESLSGGNLNVSKSVENPELTDATDVKKFRKELGGIYLAARDGWRNQIINGVKGIIGVESYSLEQVSPTLSALFIEKVFSIAVWSILLAFIMIIVIFRTPLPTLVVMSGAVADVLITLGGMGLFGIPLTLASFAAILMMVGLSLDTDMMLTIKTLKHKEGTPRERAYDAFKTGFAMTTTTISAFAILLILGIVTKISVYYQIGAIGVIGLTGDLVATWCTNAVLVLWYMDGKFGEIGASISGGIAKLKFPRPKQQ